MTVSADAQAKRRHIVFMMRRSIHATPDYYWEGSNYSTKNSSMLSRWGSHSIARTYRSEHRLFVPVDAQLIELQAAQR